MDDVTNIYIAFADINFRIYFLNSGNLPPFRGATLRGAIGYWLKKVACHAAGISCDECPIAQDCSYSVLFEGCPPAHREIMRKYSAIPQPMVLIINPKDDCQVLAGDSYTFTIRLFGNAIGFMRYLAFAIMQIGKNGLGRDRLLFDINEISQSNNDNTDEILYAKDSTRIIAAVPREYHLESITGDIDLIKIDFITPTRYRSGGVIVREPEFRSLFRNILRRITIMSYFYGNDHEPEVKSLIALADKVQTSRCDVRWSSFERFSGRQKQKMELDGFTGSACYSGPELATLYPYIKLAECLHVGKSTIFGFGQIKVSVE